MNTQPVQGHENQSKLVFELQNRRPVELYDLTQSLAAFAREYQAYADVNDEFVERGEAKLYVRQIRAGSIITELQPYIAGAIPVLESANTVIGFTKYLASAISLFTGKEAAKPVISVPTAKNLKSILEPVAKDDGAQLNIAAETVNLNIAPVYITLNSEDARRGQDRLSEMIESLREPVVGLHKQVVLHWFQTRNDATSSSGDRATIESISDKPVKVVFASESLKARILRYESNIFNIGFVVDVQVETIRNRPVLYRIIELHDELSV